MKLTIFVPCDNTSVSKLDISKNKIIGSVNLVGLVYKGIIITVKCIDSNTQAINNTVSKMLQYLSNPFNVYPPIDVKGDIILEVSIDDNMLPPGDNQSILNTVFNTIEQVYKDKDSGKMPDDLNQWYQTKINSIANNPSMTKIKERMELEYRSYGKHIIIGSK